MKPTLRRASPFACVEGGCATCDMWPAREESHLVLFLATRYAKVAADFLLRVCARGCRYLGRRVDRGLHAVLWDQRDNFFSPWLATQRTEQFLWRRGGVWSQWAAKVPSLTPRHRPTLICASYPTLRDTREI